MNNITGVLVDGYIFDVKNHMINDYHFPNTLFPGATFKMVIDDDPANNTNVVWKCIPDKMLAVSQDGTVTFPNVDESCCGKSCYIFALDKINNEFLSGYSFTVKRYFKYSTEIYHNKEAELAWITSVNGQFPARRDINDSDLNNYEQYNRREINAGLYQEWGTLANVGWKLAPQLNGCCRIYTTEKGNFYCAENNGLDQLTDSGYIAQAVAFYGEPIAK